MVGMYNLKYMEGIQTRIHTRVRIELTPSMVVILCPPLLPSLPLLLPLLLCCCYRRSEFHATRFLRSGLSRETDMLFTCSHSRLLSAQQAQRLLPVQSEYIWYLLCSHSAFLTYCAVTVHSRRLSTHLFTGLRRLFCLLLCAVLELLHRSAAPEEFQWNHRSSNEVGFRQGIT